MGNFFHLIIERLSHSRLIGIVTWWSNTNVYFHVIWVGVCLDTNIFTRSHLGVLSIYLSFQIPSSKSTDAIFFLFWAANY